MKTIYRIARTELLTLFYSPIAWLVLVVFAFQVNMQFSDIIAAQLRSKSLDYSLWNISYGVFSDNLRGLFPGMLRNLYLYLPLLTMGLISRELKSGSIKLLLSSPINNVKIILGKYLAMISYCFLLIFILFLPVLFCGITVKDFDFSLVLTGLLGMYLLICAYAAIGLFMSCLTSYQVVAAMGTLAVLAILNFIGGVGQSIEFVRDITYWLSISGRSYEFIGGLICSEDVLYFIIVISMFVTFSILKLNLNTKSKSKFYSVASYSSVIIIVMLLGYLTSLPSAKSYYDASYTKRNTLTKKSQEVMSKLTDDLKIITYVNILDKNYYSGLPSSIKRDFERFEKYVRFKPEIKMEYVYYYDKANNPNLYATYPGKTDKEIAQIVADINDLDFDMFLSPDEIRKIVDLRPERNQFVRQLVYGKNQKSWLRLFDDNQKHPSEAEITAALQRFVVKAPRVAFLKGHGERVIDRNRDKDFSAFVNNKWFRNSLLNQGFNGFNLDLSGNKEIPQEVSVIVIADSKTSFSQEEIQKLQSYIDKGGNLIIMSEPGRQHIVNPLIKQFGVEFMPGNIVQVFNEITPNVLITNYTKNAAKFSYRLENLKDWGYDVVMPGACALKNIGSKQYEYIPLLQNAKANSWNELETKDFKEEPTVFNEKVGEIKQKYTLAAGLKRKVGNKEQRIMIFGDTDFISNGELSRSRNKMNAANMAFIPGMFNWMSYGKYPIDTRRTQSIDDDISVGHSWTVFIKILFMIVIPFLLAFAGCYIWIMRKRN